MPLGSKIVIKIGSRAFNIEIFLNQNNPTSSFGIEFESMQLKSNLDLDTLWTNRLHSYDEESFGSAEKAKPR